MHANVTDDYKKTYSFRIHAILHMQSYMQMLPMITRINLLSKSYLVCPDLIRVLTLENVLFASIFFFSLQVIYGSQVSGFAYFLSLKARDSVNFQTVYKAQVSKIISRS